MGSEMCIRDRHSPGYAYAFLIVSPGSPGGLCKQEYKSVRATAMIRATLVNRHTHRQLLTRYTQPAECHLEATCCFLGVREGAKFWHDYTIGTLDVLQACDVCTDMGMTYSVIVQCTDSDCVVFPKFQVMPLYASIHSSNTHHE